MSNTEKLVFFNKEGYPYNFTLNDGIWNGKIFFEPNSTDIFKSLSLYTLESVDSIKYTGKVDIINREIYNDSGMTLSMGNYTEQLVTNIRKVNSSSKFYTKWISGDSFHKKFPVGTVISFNGDVNSGTTTGESDFINSLYFTVLNVKRGSIMISTTTSNYNYNFIFDLSYNLTVTAHGCVSIPDFDKNLQTDFDILYGEKISVVGSEHNDGVYEVNTTGYTMSRIMDYNLSGLTEGDILNVKLELLTDRPLIYQGNIELITGSVDYFTFTNGSNSNITIGSTFVCEDDNGEQLLYGNEYEIVSFVTEKTIGTGTFIFTGYTYIDNDGTIQNVYQVIVPMSYNIKINDELLFKSVISLNSLNNNLSRIVVNIIRNDATNIIVLNGFIHNEHMVNYTIFKKLKSYEQNQVIVTTNGTSLSYNGYVRCMSTTNILTYNQEVSDNGYLDTINNFVTSYSNIFKYNGIDIYGIGSILYFDGIYSGQNRYFDINVFKNTSTIITSGGTYTDNSGNTSIYNLLLNDNIVQYERKNISNELSRSYSVDITLNIYDDNQDYGFQLTVNGVQYYIPFNDNSGTTSHTLETIKSFIDLYGNAFYQNGLTIYSGTTTTGTTTINHLYIEGQEPNVHVWEMLVKVNKNSSYTLSEITDNCMMVTSNRINSTDIDFLDMGFSTGMVISISGSTYPLNNMEYNIIGLDNNTIELSYQGPMYTNENVLISLVSREYLRRPRESDDKDIYYRYRWEDDTNSNIFLFDLSGENLVPYGNNPDYTYIGKKPLCNSYEMVVLNKNVNKELQYISTPSKQQTIFEQLDFKLERFNDDNISILPKPIQTFIGYNNKNEGTDICNLIIERVDNVSFIDYANGTSLYFTILDNIITISGTSAKSYSFLNYGFKSNRYLRIKFDDLKPYTQEIFEDYQDYYITNVTNNRIYLSENLTTFTTKGQEFNFSFEMLPERIAFFSVYGETESEDERFEANLKLLGIDLTEEDEYIFSQSDVKEDGIDYRLLNRKRKEMLNTFPDIYNYIGSYRAILNSIDFFGYTDIDLMEYYKNIDPRSPYYKKLKKILIPELTDRTVDGWTYSEDLSNNLSYVKTNLFNLTYKITDEEGNNILLYSLKEIQTKLTGLKKWLRRNVIPINSNVRDITGLAHSPGTIWRRFDSCVNVTKNVTTESNDAVNFNYMVTRNFNDSWLVSVRFYTVSGNIPEFFDLKVITYSKNPDTGVLEPQQRYDVFKTDLNNFNFSINWDGYINDEKHDHFFYIQTTNSNSRGVSKIVNKMYNLETGNVYYFDEYKNYVLINNIFRYKRYDYVQNKTNVYIIDEQGNFYTIDKPTEKIV